MGRATSSCAPCVPVSASWLRSVVSLSGMRLKVNEEKSGVRQPHDELPTPAGFFRGGGCDCMPEIWMSGPDGVVTIDARGIGIRRARS
jgi:hypothetical protein